MRFHYLSETPGALYKLLKGILGLFAPLKVHWNLEVNILQIQFAHEIFSLKHVCDHRKNCILKWLYARCGFKLVTDLKDDRDTTPFSNREFISLSVNSIFLRVKTGGLEVVTHSNCTPEIIDETSGSDIYGKECPRSVCRGRLVTLLDSHLFSCQAVPHGFCGQMSNGSHCRFMTAHFANSCRRTNRISARSWRCDVTRGRPDRGRLFTTLVAP